MNEDPNISYRFDDLNEIMDTNRRRTNLAIFSKSQIIASRTFLVILAMNNSMQDDEDASPIKKKGSSNKIERRENEEMDLSNILKGLNLNMDRIMEEGEGK